MTQTYDDVLNDLYLNPDKPTAFGGVTRLLDAAKKLRPSIKRTDVTAWLEGQDAYTLHKPSLNRYSRRKTIVAAPNHQLQADLLDIRSYAKDNDGATFLLTAVDAFSRRAWVVPIKNKTGDTVARALATIIDNEDFFSLQTDKGKEFYNSKVKEVLKAKNIKHFSTENETIKASFVERFNRTLRDKVFRYMTASNTRRFISVLPGLVHGYNVSVHGSTGYAPLNVDSTNQSEIFYKLYEGNRVTQTGKTSSSPLDVGEFVRVTKARGVFDRGYTPNWTTELFKISEVMVFERPVVYRVVDYAGESVKGTFYRQELQRVREPDSYRIEKIIRSRRRVGGNGKEHLVKWMGYPDSFNSWVSDDDIADI